MEKYRKVQKPKEPSPPEEIRVTGVGHVCNYVTYTARLLNQNHNTITIRATGKAVSIAVSVAEVVKRRFKGLHQVTTIGCTQLINEYEPMEEGLDKIEESRTVSFISIQLARDDKISELDKDSPGYQGPLDESLVKELDPSMLSRFPRPRGRGGRGRSFRGGGGGGGFGFPRGGRGRGNPRGRRGGSVGGPMMMDGPPHSSMMVPPRQNINDMFDDGSFYRGGGMRGRGGRGGMRGGGGGFHPGDGMMPYSGGFPADRMRRGMRGGRGSIMRGRPDNFGRPMNPSYPA